MKRYILAILFALLAVPCWAGSRDLKEDTAVVVVVGPFVDTAGAAVTAPTIASIDITAYKNDGTAVTITPAASGTSNDMVHVDDGYFSLELTTTDTSTPGYLRLTFQISGSLIFHEDFNILPANLYDSKYSTDKLEVDIAQFGGTNGTFSGGRPEVNTTHAAGTAWGSGAITAASIASDAITSSEVATTAAQEIADANRNFVAAITATQDGTTTTFEFTGGASVTNFYVGMGITTFDASNSSLPHEAVVTAYDGGTGILTFSPASPYTIATGDTAVLQRASRTTYAAWLKLPSKSYLAGSSNSDGDVQLDEATGSLASGAIAASSFASGAIDAAAIGANAIGSSELAADSITSSELATTAATEIWDNDPKLILSTTSTAGSSGTSLVLATAGLYDDSTSLVGATAYIYDASDSNKLSVRQITTWDGTLTNAAELDSAPDFAPANGDVVKIYTTPKVRVGTSGIVAASFAANAIDASAVAANAIGASEIANSAIDAATFATGAIDAAATAADFTLEVLAPIISDAASEPSSTPVANAPLSTKISWIFKGWRNGMTVTSSERTLLNDNGTEDIDWELSDDGTTATVTEAAAVD